MIAAAFLAGTCSTGLGHGWYLEEHPPPCNDVLPVSSLIEAACAAPRPSLWLALAGGTLLAAIAYVVTRRWSPSARS